MPNSHAHTLSVNSVLSLAEPTTPPHLLLWDSSKMTATLALPSFSLEPEKKMCKIDKDYLALVSKVPLSQLLSDIVRMARDQHGCRFLQKRIDENVVANPQVRVANFEVIFAQVCLLWYDLIVDPFGNYLIQKLVDYCEADKLDVILQALQHNLFQISVNQHGTRALQKVIDLMSTPHQLQVLVGGLRPYIIELIKDLNGNHVIQKILNKYPPEHCQFIYDAILDDLLTVATHKHGCCVLQKCLNHVNTAQLAAFSRVILDYDVFTRLVNDQFGNYVLQYLVSIDSLDVDAHLYSNFLRYGVDRLCNLKFSSNVIEKLMKNCYANEPRLVGFSDLKFGVILLILQGDISKLINDPYGNYVVQTLLDILVNPAVSYVVDGALLPSLLMLLMNNPTLDPVQVQVIKIWFQHCKIVSSYGKRIQLKINIILNGKSRKPLGQGQGQMNANGEFVKGRMPRSMSMDNLYKSGLTENYYAFAKPHGPAYDAMPFADLANLHISSPKTTVPYAKVYQTMSHFSTNEFMTGAPDPGFGQFQDRLRPGSMNFQRPRVYGHQRHVSDSSPFDMLGGLRLFQG